MAPDMVQYLHFRIVEFPLIFGGLSQGLPQKRWMVYFMESPICQWMMTGGGPMTLETTINSEFQWDILSGYQLMG